MPHQNSHLTPRFQHMLTLCVSLLAGCASYEASPVNPISILEELDAVRLNTVTAKEVAPIVTSFDASDGLTLLEASAVGVRRNPDLTALREDIGVSQAQLVQAGLLPDPVIGWNAMDAGADLIIDGKVDGASWLTGFSLSWDVPRPGEIDAQEGVARARLRSAAVRLMGAEWVLVRKVQVAYVRLLAARAGATQTQRLAGIAQRALEFFEKARKAGAATALEEGLARVAAGTVRADLLRATNELLLARQGLNRLLGLPPGAAWKLQDSLTQLNLTVPEPEKAQELVRESLARRPDLLAARANYQEAEEQLRLEVSRQWPQISIGTGLSIQLPIFSRLNRPAIQAARHNRDGARARYRAAVQRVRTEIHSALAISRQAYALFALFQTTLGPQTELTLRLTERAFNAREVTPLQILAAQRQVLDTQARFLAARRGWAEARIRLDSACGRLLPSARTPLPSDDEESR